MTKQDDDCKITTSNRICDDFGNAIDPGVINLKAPNVVVDVEDVFLMWFWSK